MASQGTGKIGEHFAIFFDGKSIKRWRMGGNYRGKRYDMWEVLTP